MEKSFFSPGSGQNNGKVGTGDSFIIGKKKSFSSFMGSPDVLTVRADVSNLDDCKKFVDEAIKHFARCKILNSFITCSFKLNDDYFILNEHFCSSTNCNTLFCLLDALFCPYCMHIKLKIHK